jgi:hypothetical protein
VFAAIVKPKALCGSEESSRKKHRPLPSLTRHCTDDTRIRYNRFPTPDFQPVYHEPQVSLRPCGTSRFSRLRYAETRRQLRRSNAGIGVGVYLRSSSLVRHPPAYAAADWRTWTDWSK